MLDQAYRVLAATSRGGRGNAGHRHGNPGDRFNGERSGRTVRLPRPVHVSLPQTVAVVDPLPATCPHCSSADWRPVTGFSSSEVTEIAAIGRRAGRYEPVVKCCQCGTEWNKPAASTLQRQAEAAFELQLREFNQRQAALDTADSSDASKTSAAFSEPAAAVAPVEDDWENPASDANANGGTYLLIERLYGGLRGMLGRFTIYVDGGRKSRLAAGRSCLLAVEPGPHRLRAEFGFGTWRSADLDIDVPPGRTIHVELESWGSLILSSNKDMDTTRPWFRLRITSTAPLPPHPGDR